MEQLLGALDLIGLRQIIARAHLILPKLLLGRAHHFFKRLTLLLRALPKGSESVIEQSGPGLQPALLRPPLPHC